MIDITVSIVNWNTRDELMRCLESVFAQQKVSLEVIVVDNASSDGSAEEVMRRFPKAVLIANDKNAGFGRAQNQSLERYEGRYFMLLNPDAILPEADTLAKIVDFADRNQGIGIIGPRIENPDGSLQYSARRFPTVGAGLFRRTPFGKLFPKNRFVKDYIISDWGHREVRDVDWVSGAALVIRRETVEDIGHLDPGFFMYCEDVDWAYRAKQRGWRVTYFPAATVVHRIGAASDQAPVRMIYHFHRSMFRFYLKHYAKGWKILLVPAALAALAARALFFIILTRIPISREALNGGERLVR
ncbi:MAG: glycosyltransferase family 2 protein [Armatimonadetes bacterium]|nr:glycosyltransferase family 2 protein [Armatimonadota bacterium]